MTGHIALRGYYFICFFIIVVSTAIYPVSKPEDHQVITKNELILNQENNGTRIEKFIQERSFVTIGYTHDLPFENETHDFNTELGECSLYIYCRPTGSINPSVHCFIITHDNRQRRQIVTKFTAGQDPKKRGTIHAWRVEQSKEKITKYVRCIQCGSNNNIPCYKIECLRKNTQEFNDTRFKYDYSAKNAPNSNSFVTGILDKCGFSLASVDFPDGATGYEYVFN
jgi:hypothetical protein